MAHKWVSVQRDRYRS